MSAQLYALGRWCYRYRGRVIAAWLAILIVIGGLALAFRGPLSNDFEIPGSSSQAALDRLRMTFPQGAAQTATGVIVAPDGMTVDDLRPQIEAAAPMFEANPLVESVNLPWNEIVSGLVSQDHKAAMMVVTVDITGTPTPEQLAELTAIAQQVQATMPAGTTFDLGGQIYNLELPALSIVEVIGLGVALVVLTLMLGSLVAAGLPLLTALIGVGIAMAILFLVARISSINSVTPLLAVMLGLAVGIDYALFILSRHRNQLRAGMDAEESAARSVGTAGSAVVFAGMTVFVALVGLGVANIPFLTVMGIFAAMTVALAVCIALTMLPALMGVLGDRMRPKSKPVSEDAEAKPKRAGVFGTWVGVVTKHPLVTIIVIVLGLGALALPARSMTLSLPNSGQHEVTAPDRIAYDLITEHFGPGYNNPLVVTADIIGSTDPLGLVAELKSDIEALPGVAAVPLATPNQNADTALIQVVPTTASDDPATVDLVNELRTLTDQWLTTKGINASVTGVTAVQLDVTDRLAGALVPFVALVVGLSVVLLAAVFRSVWVPIKAAVGFLLSLGASFGLTTLVFNEGWLKQLVNLERPTTLISFLPILLTGILFGLAMDYEVFLVSRIREEYVHGKSASDAIKDGFIASAPVVVAAAFIMFSVFAFFVPEGMLAIKQIAFALAVGVAFDAFVVRMCLVPAVLALLGDRAWWLPAWLDKLLPSFDVEGEVLTKQLALADWPGDGSLVHTEELAVEGVMTPLNLTAAPGTVVGISGPVGARTGTLLALTGRLETTSGRARVANWLLPERADRVRRNTSYVDLGTAPDVVAALTGLDPLPGSVLVLDSVEVVSTEPGRDAVKELAALARSRRDFTLIIGAAAPGALTRYEPDGQLEVADPNLQGSLA